jgi:hypothetical protein
MSKKRIVIGLVTQFLLVFLGIQGIIHLYENIRSYTATKQAQAYINSKVPSLPIIIKVSECVEIPTNEVEHNWACLLTVKIAGVSKTEVLQFTPGNLAGRPDPVSNETFDHDQDTNI